MEIDHFAVVDEQAGINKNPLAPQWPFRLLIVGPSACGKTNLVVNLLLKHLHFDNLFLYSKHLDQAIYKHLQQEVEGTYSDQQNDVFEVDVLNADEQNLIVFDDMITARNQKVFTDFFLRGRHKNSSVIYVTQSYYTVPKNLRLNFNYFALFDVQNGRHLEQFRRDHANINKKVFTQICREAVAELYSSMVIDKQTKLQPLMYRKQFDGLCCYK